MKVRAPCFSVATGGCRSRSCALLQKRLVALQVVAIPFLWPAFMANPAHQLPFYQEASGDTLAAVEPGSSREAASTPLARVGPSKETIQVEVARAIQSVLGPGIGSGTPLVQAGLDSLGQLSSLLTQSAHLFDLSRQGFQNFTASICC